MEVVNQWKQAIVYPRWAALSHWGYGEARFFFYPPASWHLGALIGAMLPWKVAPGAYIWVALTLAGISMFLLAREYLGRSDAIFASALYAANPYLLVIVYWRSAFAELLAASLLPLLLLMVLRMADDSRRAVIPLSMLVAAVWLTNVPSAVMSMYSLTLLLVIVATVRRDRALLLQGATAMLLGVSLAAFYIVPAAYETRWVNISQVLAPGVRPGDNFLFTTIADPDHNRFNLLVTVVASAQILSLAGAALLLRRWRTQNALLWWTLSGWALASILLMFSPTVVLWNYLPKLRFVQLPWRWLLCLGVPFALFVTMGIRRWWGRAVLSLVLLGIILVGWNRIQTPWWDGAPDIKEMTDAMEDGIGYEGTDEYVPIGVDPYDTKQDAPKIIPDRPAASSIKIRRWTPESKVVSVVTDEPLNLILKLYNYPAWKTEISGRVVPVNGRKKSGEMVIPVAKGDSLISITLTRTWDRTLGIVISLLTLALMILIAVRQRLSRRADRA
jgi:hypothetical protein